MNRIEQTFSTLQSQNRTAFMPYIVAGDPDLETTKLLIPALADAGANLIELGVPFSDPLADGPTNQAAAERALKSGTTLAKILDTVKAVRATCQIPLLLMGYYNSFFHYGLERFCNDAAKAGVDGLIIPDLQPDDADEIRAYADTNNLCTVFLIAPTSTPERLKLVGRESRGFVYAVSLTGVTGARDMLSPELGGFLKTAREYISLPIAVGFGIGSPEMAKSVAKLAEGVIVGSAIVKRIAAAVEHHADPVPPIKQFVTEMTAVL